MSRIIMFGGQRPISAEFVGPLVVGSVSAGGGTVSSVPLGAAAGGRKSIIAVHAFGASGSNPVLTAATIGGETAVVFEGGTMTDANDPALYWIGADVPSGTSGNVFLNFSDAVGLRLGVFRVLNAQSLTPTDTGLNVFGFTASDQTVLGDVVNRGIQFGAATVLQSGGTKSFTAGISSPSYSEAFGSGDGYVMGGFELITATQSNRAITIATVGGGTWRGVLSSVSFR